MSLLRSLLILPLLALAGCATDAARHWVELDGARYQGRHIAEIAIKLKG